MKKVYIIGRDDQSDIVIDDNSDVVSRLHATIRIDGNKMYLIDQSQNGTYVNGIRMSANEEIPVTREDTISFANVAELDWSLVPDPKKAQMKAIVFVIAALVIVAAISFAVWHSMNAGNQSYTEESIMSESSDLRTTDSDENIIADTDSSLTKKISLPEVVSPSSPENVNNGDKTTEEIVGQPKEEVKKTPKVKNEIPLY